MSAFFSAIVAVFALIVALAAFVRILDIERATRDLAAHMARYELELKRHLGDLEGRDP